jgi:hypothetical protein
MQIGYSSTGPLLTLALTGGGAASPPWQDGQILNARVIEARNDGRLLLQLEGYGKPVEARSPLPLAAGQQVKLTVAIESDRIVLRLLEQPAEEPAVQQAWRTALPRQVPLASVLQTIARLLQLPPAPAATGTSPPTGAGSNLPPPLPPAAGLPLTPPPIRLPDTPTQAQAPTAPPAETPAQAQTPTAEKLTALAQQLLSRSADPQRLTTAEGLRQALLNSGVFLEGRLARGDTAALQDDFGAGLLRLLGAVREQAAAPAVTQPRGAGAPPAPLSAGLLQELSQAIEGALARVKVQQLHTLTAQNASDPAWLLELPLRHGSEAEVLRLRIRREGGNSGGNAAPGWSVRLHFDSPQHGGVDSVVTLLGGRIGVSFWAERPHTAERLGLRLEELRGQLQHAGLEVEHLRSAAGRAAPDDDPVPAGLLNLSV